MVTKPFTVKIPEEIITILEEIGKERRKNLHQIHKEVIAYYIFQYYLSKHTKPNQFEIDLHELYQFTNNEEYQDRILRLSKIDPETWKMWRELLEKSSKVVSKKQPGPKPRKRKKIKKYIE